MVKGLAVLYSTAFGRGKERYHKQMNRIYLNKKIVPENKALVSVLDRGFLYGDGVYETLRAYKGKLFRPERHWQRLDHSLKSIYMQIPWSHAELTRACEKTVRANPHQECLVRLTISRGVGKVGYDPASCKKPTLVIFSLPVRNDMPELWRKGVSVAVAKVRRNHPLTLNPAIKCSNCLNGILAKIESLKSGAFEGIFFNLDGSLAEGTISNVFLIKNGVLKTPALDCGLLDGVTRSLVIEAAHNLKVPVRQTKIRGSEIYAADELFLTSTTMEILGVVAADKKKIGGGTPGPISQKLHAEVRQIIQRELKLPESFSTFS